MENKGEIIIYKTGDNETQIEVKFEKETVWLSQKQMSLLFEKGVRTINEHIKNVYKEMNTGNSNYPEFPDSSILKIMIKN
ncbi:MAG: hypothetical protein M3R36_10715 [Bacteroidota bacterium]|nr:hypothetical protein [Bacteroidota bacterium]